jgi:hypothetical protein
MELLSNKWVQIAGGAYVGASAYSMIADSTPAQVAVVWPYFALQLFTITQKPGMLLPIAAPLAASWAAYTYGPATMNPWILTLAGGVAGYFISKAYFSAPSSTTSA